VILGSAKLGPDGLEEFWKLLGRFVWFYADAESSLHFYLQSLSTMDFVAFNAFLGNIRVEQGIQSIRRIRQAKDLPNDIRLERALSQLQIINRARNHILHYKTNFSDVDSGFGVVSDAYRAIPGRQKSLDVSPEILIQLTNDTRRITNFLVAAMMRQSRMPIPEQSIAHWEVGIDDAWQFRETIKQG
jgi:hypothetical protein